MNTEKSLILSNPAAGWCSFTLKTDEGEFHASLSYLTDVMLDTLKACLTALQTEAAAVMYNRESEGTFLFVLSDHDVYILDENLESGMIRFENISVTEICEKVLDSYDASPAAWINFSNMNDQSEADYNKYEETETAEIKKVIEEIRKLLV